MSRATPDTAVSPAAIGTVTTNAGGILQIAFNAQATQKLVEIGLQQIAYSNKSETPPSMVTLKWTLVDGDAVTPLAASTTTNVYITAIPPNVVTGTKGNDTITTTKAVKGKTATAEEDVIDGKKGNDKIKAGAGEDTLIGGAGRDTLSGGADKDAFVFNKKLGASNVDLIKDFKHDIDVIHLDDKIFKKIGPTLEAKEFYAKKGATEAHDKNDRIIYDKATGKLYYDADGNKDGKAAVHFATLNKHPTLDAGDFLIV